MGETSASAVSTDDDDEGSGTDSEEGMRWAADEPTAMWDESLLEQEGFDALVKDRSANPREETGPATIQKTGGRSSTGSIEVSADATGGHKAVAAPKRRASGLSWALTFGIAIALGAAVYFIVRFLR